jgi:hypothetical protein
MARITIDKLAEIVVNEFQSLRQEIARDFRQVRETLADHTVRLDRIERKLDDTIARVDDHSVRLERLEKPH